ncbi:ATP-grasp domain-containing protein [Vibrio lentus]|uniref:ATP-grasp domain-containing protein n=1 Tax=Vibrio lentus TaxID=136468 RepID=UPI000C8318B9|nr:ATP-grasp domain-containing protein [Vibrio lentus]PMJ04514.1 hypothetical protein BCU32_03145 [Vibrio lentus]
MKHLLIIGAWPEAVIKCIEVPGIRVSVINPADWSEQDIVKKAKYYIESDITNFNKCLNHVKMVNQKQKIDFIITMVERSLDIVASISDKLGIPSVSSSLVRNTRYKNLLRGKLTGSKFDNIPWIYLPKGDKVEKDLSNSLADKFIAKPCSGSGSKGIKFLDHKDLECFSDIESDYVIEKFVDGPEFSVESFSIRGKHYLLPIVEKVTNGIPSFTEIKHIVPANISESCNELIKKNVIQFLDLLNVKESICHTELKVVDDEVYIIETQTRPGGDRIWKMLEECTDLDYINLFVSALFHQENELLNDKIIDDYKPKKIVINKYFNKGGGVIEKVSELRDILDDKSIVCSDVPFQEGYRFRDMNSSSQRNGFIVYSGDEYNDLNDHIDHIEHEIYSRMVISK